jgi:hypothetical protein
MADARKTDPETSHEAAASVHNETITHRRILNIFSTFSSLSDETLIVEFHRKYGRTVSESGIRSRRKELVRNGKVVFADDYGLTVAKRRTRLWKLA